MRVHRHVGMLFTLAVLLLGCAAPPSSTERASGTVASAPTAMTGPKRIVAAIPGVPAVLDSRFDTSSNRIGYVELANLYSAALTVFDDSGTLIPLLAEQVPSVENGGWTVAADGAMQTRWTLKSGVTWHDGTPITTRDLLFTDQVAHDRDLPQTIPPWLAFLDRLEAPDARTVVAYWKQPYIAADQLFNTPFLPAHILEKPYRENKETFLAHPYLSTEFVGTGPFKLKDFQPATYVVLTAFDGYVRGRPKLDEIEVRFISDFNTLVTNVVAGAVDLTMGRGISVEQGVSLRDTWTGGRVDLSNNNLFNFHAQYIDPNPAVVSDVRFHRALLFALDRQEMVESIQHGLTQVAHIPLDSNHPKYNEILARVPKYDFNPGRAAQLLQELGYTKGTDGLLRNAAGQKLELELRTVNTDINLKIAPAMAHYFRQAGIDMTEVVFSTQQAADRPYRVSFPGIEMLRAGYGEDTFVGWMHSSRVPTAENRYTAGNYPRYSNKEWDALIDRYAVTIPYEERMKAMSDLIYFLEDQLPAMTIFFDKSVVLVSNRVVNAGAHQGGQRGVQGWNADTWDLK